MMEKRVIDIKKTIDLLELDKNNFDFFRNTDYQTQCIELEKFKEDLKKQRRTLSVKYHPDKGGDEEKMKEINDIIDLLLSTEIEPPRPVQHWVWVNLGGPNGMTAATDSTTGGW